MAVAKAWFEWMPNMATATAMANGIASRTT